jgi:crotonobetainyl-CoA:carnitine CoA-transferase CaiB-like acyl-CoA transferase
MAGPLAGIHVLDFTTVVMGPYATQILGDMGADVIKVESPQGDNMRWVGPMRNPGMGHIFMHANRNKRSLVLDLKKPAGLKVAMQLAARADVLVHNVRPQAMARLGLYYDAVKAVNQKIVYVAAYGFSEKGTYAGRPAYDDLIQGAAGVASLSQRQSGDVPRYSPALLADRSVGLQVVNAILAALFHRERSGIGQAIDITMFEALSQFVLGDHMGGMTFVPPIGEGEAKTGYARLLAAHRKPYQTADGYLCVLIYNDKHWQSFFKLIGREDLLADPRFKDHTARAANIASVYEFVAGVLLTKTSAAWTSLLDAADIPAMPMHTIESLIEDPHLKSINYFQQLDHPSEGRIRTTAPLGEWSETPPSIRSTTPRLGEHSVHVLSELGYDATAIEEMLAAGVSAVPCGVKT